MILDMAEAEKYETGFEARRLTAYYDICHVLTIGVGHKVLPADPYKEGSTITDAECDLLFKSDATLFMRQIDKAMTNPNLTPNQNLAIFDFVFNLGIHSFLSSTLLKDVNAGNLMAAADEFPKWIHAHVDGHLVEVPDLIKRRDAERTLFLSDLS